MLPILAEPEPQFITYYGYKAGMVLSTLWLLCIIWRLPAETVCSARAADTLVCALSLCTV